MDKLTHYREIIRKELQGYADWLTNPKKEIRFEVVFDPILDHFELVEVGWDEHRRIHLVLFHLDLIDGKVWVQHDATDRPIATELIRAGIPKEDIVLGFYPAEVRAQSGFGIG